jgi:hypothetical protein
MSAEEPSQKRKRLWLNVGLVLRQCWGMDAWVARINERLDEIDKGRRRYRLQAGDARRTPAPPMQRPWFEVVGHHDERLIGRTTEEIIYAFPHNRVDLPVVSIWATVCSCFSQSLYAVVNNRGVCQVLTPAVWKLKVPSRIHIFLWLLANNKTLTRDNLAKRKNLKDLTCVFCNELETVHHLFFDCCVANVLWSEISEALGMVVNPDFESVAKMWLLGKNFQHINVCTAAVLWSIWKLRNEFIFQGRSWSGIGELLRRCARMVQDWSMLSKCEDGAHLEELANVLGMRSRLPPRLAGSHQLQSMRSLVSETVTPLRENAMSVSPETEPGDTVSKQCA